MMRRVMEDSSWKTDSWQLKVKNCGESSLKVTLVTKILMKEIKQSNYFRTLPPT